MGFFSKVKKFNFKNKERYEESTECMTVWVYGKMTYECMDVWVYVYGVYRVKGVNGVFEVNRVVNLQLFHFSLPVT